MTHWFSDEVLTIAIADELDNHEARACIEYIGTATTLYPSGDIVLDLSGLTFTDSSGLAVVMNLYRIAKRTQRRLVVYGAPAQAMRVFQAANLGQLVRFVDRSES